MKRTAKTLVFLLLALLALPASRGQALEEALFTVGTTTVDKQNRHWAYVLFQPTEVNRLAGRKVAIYMKSGNADSAAPFERKAIVTAQQDPAIIQTLLNRAVNLGENIAELEVRVNDLFAELVPNPGMTLAEKLSAIIRGSQGRPEYLQNLLLMGRLHPAVNLCIGLAHAEMIPAGGVATFEAREFDLAANRDLGVLGRVTIEAGKPTVIPAPSAPFAVHDPSAKGHLNARLRWATSDDARRLGLLSYGFNVYRVTRAFAEANNFHVKAPTPDALKQFAALNPAVRRINDVPILKTRDYSINQPAEFTNPADTTSFVADDNRIGAGNPPFENGSQYYYFVTGRDVLGRDGLVSGGTLVTLCFRAPPYAPRKVSVQNVTDYPLNAVRQRLKVTWRQVTNVTTESITGYFVYRWAQPTDPAKLAGNPVLNRISPLIPHQPGKVELDYFDDGPGSPTAPQDFNKTFWYTVRAVDDGACDGGNLSPNSAPAFGVLRDREGPEAPGGYLSITCCQPVAVPQGYEDLRTATRMPESRVWIDFIADRTHRDIEWAEFYLYGTDPTNRIARVEFPNNGDRIRRRYSIPRLFAKPAPVAFCRVGTSARVSDFASLQSTGLPDDGLIREFRFEGRVRCERVRFDELAAKSGCNSHNPHPNADPSGPGGGNAPTAGVDIFVDLPVGTKEYRVYRRVDNGPLSLIRKGEADAGLINQIQVTDTDMPANAATICYYCQVLDRHGNGSEMKPIGECLEIAQPPVVPQLAKLKPAGDDDHPQMVIQWFCPPQGIERFEVLLGVRPGPYPKKPSPVLSENLNTNPVEFAPDELALNADAENPFPQQVPHARYETPPPGQGFGDGATFEVVIPIERRTKYDVQIRAIAKGGVSRLSNARKFKWGRGPAGDTGPGVPWPVRDLPPISDDGFNPGISSRHLGLFGYDGIGIRIGQVPADLVAILNLDGKLVTHIKGDIHPNSLTYTNGPGSPLLGKAVLYRYQVPSARFPKVSGDITQVSPMMETIAHSTGASPQGTVTRITDPFVLLTIPDSNQFPLRSSMYLLDTQPVIRKAAYAYVLARFDSAGELEEIVKVPPVEVP